MPRFAANLSTMFREHDWLARPMAAKRAGFDAVEIQYPYEIDLEALARAKRDADVQWLMINVPAGNQAAGERGIACLPGREADFREGIALCRRYGEALGIFQVNTPAGIPPTGVERARIEETLIGNLNYAAEELGKAGIKVLVEPLNTRDVPGFFVTRADQALDLIDRAGHANLGLLHDLYHAQVMVGDLMRNLERLMPRIGHIQFADPPGRHEPGSGELNWPALFALIDKLGYRGWVSAEYFPTGNTADSLGWMATPG
ncbi:MAG: TIM barrel protein [Alphaproteobacteria bacterium]|nr:TIM barrel protein [Alphaproteobacteria bacterium]